MLSVQDIEAEATDDMRRTTILIFLIGMLAALVAARAVQPEKAVPVLAEDYGNNILSLAPPTVTETAGSGMIGELSAYFLSREPTAKNAWTGALRGKSLVLLCADEWAPDPDDRRGNPALYRLARESAAVPNVWRPDWYQGEEGQIFAVLSGLAPTRVGDESALRYAGEQSVYLPFALPRRFAREGYACAAFLRDGSLSDAAYAMGFGAVRAGCDNGETVRAVLAALDGDAPAFAFCQWSGSGEEALAELLAALEETHRTDTALCLLTADADGERAQLYLWGAGLSGAAADVPCSELDLPPTLLNLFGISFDSRFLSGRDIFAPAGDPARPDAATPLVTLGGSAFSAWVTDAGRYDPAADTDASAGSDADRNYIRAVCTLNWQRYVFARRVMETDCFALIFGGRE